MRKLFCLLLVAAMVGVAGTAWSWDVFDHVKLAPNGKGDVVIYPVYYADAGGWETKLTLINTDANRSVVAKLIVRGQKYSIELLDFMIFLSPADVWTGTLKWDGTRVIMESTDDSCLYNANPTWASTTKFVAPLNIRCGEDGKLGYVEVIESISWFEPNGPKVSKDDIYHKYYTPAQGDTNPPPADVPDAWFNGDLVENVLAGSYEIINDTIGSVGSNQATVLADYDNTLRLSPFVETFLGSDSWNNLCEVEAALHQNDVSLPYYNSNDKTTFHIFTFPTKLLRVNPDCTRAEARGPFFVLNTAVAPAVAGRGEGNDRSIRYSFGYYDLSENRERADQPIVSPAPQAIVSTFPYEVNLVTPRTGDGDMWNSVFAEGWAQYRFSWATTLTCDALRGVGTTTDKIRTKDSAPVIATTVFYTPGKGMSIMSGAGSVENFTAVTAVDPRVATYTPVISYDRDTAVLPDFTAVPKYQYRDGHNGAGPADPAQAVSTFLW